ncbi:uncharacterized protein LOC106673010 isoform X1 [Cimex lectularius]|uniref:MADF domain-containing protein n=1 Tax=Cimex lectularius TaxID=79782 RepID=A0A8I6S7D6_CIMLE|nr:uncharacterized protein LOC106673010 isoform X1 [Cimex lectularius]
MNDELLIELVRERPVLYDLKDPKYLNADWKGRIWQEIGLKINVDGSQCKSRWNNIRDNFKKSWGKRKTKSGQAAKKSKPYRFENQLQFLLEFMEERETKGNIGLHPDSENGEFNDDNEEETRLTNNIVSPPQSSNQPSSPPFEEHPTTSNDIPSTSAACFARPTPVTGRKKTPQHETAASALMKYVIENNEGKKNTPTVTLDNPIDCFLFGISATMKSMPPYLQHLAKSEIFSTVQKYELQMLQNQQGQVIQHSPYTNAASFQPGIGIIDDTSSTGSAESVREYWQAFGGEQP